MGNPAHQAFWFASRAFGITAMILLAVSVGLGLMMSSRILRRPGLPAMLKRGHESLTLVTLAMIVVHGGLLLFDAYLRPGLVGIAVPFQLSYRPVFTGVGIIAGWSAAILGLSFYVRRWIGTRTWRFMHRFTIVVYLLALVHVAGAGTDAGRPWMLALLTALTTPIAFAFSYRVLSATHGRPHQPLSARSALRITARSMASWKRAPAMGGR
jgi:sulfoxide reductase heme-binding subunit YedZ